MENKEMMTKSHSEVNSFKSELYKLRNELERLIEGQTVIREDIADNKQQLSLSFKQIQRNLNKDVESQARYCLTLDSLLDFLLPNSKGL